MGLGNPIAGFWSFFFFFLMSVVPLSSSSSSSFHTASPSKALQMAFQTRKPFKIKMGTHPLPGTSPKSPKHPTWHPSLSFFKKCVCVCVCVSVRGGGGGGRGRVGKGGGGELQPPWSGRHKFRAPLPPSLIRLGRSRGGAWLRCKARRPGRASEYPAQPRRDGDGRPEREGGCGLGQEGGGGCEVSGKGPGSRPPPHAPGEEMLEGMGGGGGAVGRGCARGTRLPKLAVRAAGRVWGGQGRCCKKSARTSCDFTY